MVKLMKNCITEVNVFSLNLSLHTYLYINKTQNVFDGAKKVIVMRETGDEYGIAGMKVITRDMGSVHVLLKAMTEQNLTGNSVKKHEKMTIEYRTFIGLILGVVTFICVSLFLLFLLISNKFGRIGHDSPTPESKTKPQTIEKTKPEQKSPNRISKLSISGPMPFIVKRQSLKGDEPLSPGSASVDFAFDFDETEESDKRESGINIDRKMSKKEINAYSTVENLCQLSPIVVANEKLNQ